MLKNCGWECNGCESSIFNGNSALLILPNGEKFAFCGSKCMSKWLASFQPEDLNKVAQEKIEKIKKMGKPKSKKPT